MNTYTTQVPQHSRTQLAGTDDVTRPVTWLNQGWNDFLASPINSLLIGGAFTLLCLAAYAAISVSPLHLATMLALMLLVSPFIAATAYSIARQQTQLPATSLRDAIYEVRMRALGIGVFSVLCALIVGAWVRLSSIVFALYYGNLEVNAAAELARAWTAGFEYPTMLLFFIVAGTALGITLFSVGALALPMIAEKDTDIITAIGDSFARLRKHALTMLVWVSLIIGAFSLAMLSSLILMPIIFPILAYASWYSYKHISSN